MKDMIYVTKALLPSKKDYFALLSDIWDTHCMTNYGPLHHQFSEALKEYMEIHYLSLCCNGHLGLESILQVMQLKGEVITTPFSFASSTNAILRCGLTPVFCDVRMEDYTIDPEKIEACITKNTSAILAVHVYGRLCCLEEIEEIARRHDLPVIYDAAHIFGIKCDDFNPYLFGTASVISFHATKVFNTIEGGAVITQNAGLNDKLDYNHNFGICDMESTEITGGNAKMNEFSAAMGLCNLKLIQEEIQKRSKVAERYRQNLNTEKKIKLLSEQKGVHLNHAYFPIVFLQEANPRDDIYRILYENGYFARRYFYPLTCDLKCNQGKGRIADNLKVARYVSDRVLCLPIYGDLEMKHVDRICEIILQEVS